ncbi:hypothetical protein IW261DRAFT_1026632 [Armillaria novae-zelandiae]|uniref:Pectate lyase n=1 Tax=Armillaria novae-zelandiae TaxID=153914 RepID=A0AA39UH33_9AGAR|nr:hypothetical protein IW261DRAFT_1026632 [Armillaria novae-zelandiae]
MVVCGRSKPVVRILVLFWLLCADSMRRCWCDPCVEMGGIAHAPATGQNIFVRGGYNTTDCGREGDNAISVAGEQIPNAAKSPSQRVRILTLWASSSIPPTVGIRLVR